ncbi:response regulator transcription factor [Actinocrispum sp. NPDC049592]|uniref:response regulator transcription factor n=1 Tax=Actinocrispum sp. NPDC049592 TaxID=3154835 RepID=UPI0034369398
MADKPITAVIIDDHAVVTAGVRYWCATAEPPIELVDAGARLANVWTGPGGDADVVIFDLQLNGEQQEFRELRRLVDSGRRIVVYTQDAHNATAVRCVELGALAYVTKREGPEHLVAAVRAAAKGFAYTPPSLSGALVADEDPNRPRLAPQEIAALRAWFASSSKRLAAEMLGISVKTVDTYIERVRIRYASVGRPAPTKSDLVARALEDKLITLSELNNTT